MKTTLYIPFANGDPVNGFQYEGRDIKAEEYAKMENEEYYSNRKIVDHMVVSSLGNNMAINTYQKRKINVKPQSYAFHKCEGNIRNIDGSEISVSQLDRLWANREQFGLYVYLDEKEFLKKPDLEIDLKMWIKDSLKILNIPSLPDEEKLKHLPKKNFKIDFDGGKSHAVLQNCKFMKLLSAVKKANGEVVANSFGMIIERIVFTKN